MFCFALIKEIINLFMLFLLLRVWICRGKKKQQESSFCSWNTIMARTLIKMTRTVLWLSCICREKSSTGRRMTSSLKPIPPSPTNLTWYFMAQSVAGIAAPVMFQMLCTELQQIVFVKALSTWGYFSVSSYWFVPSSMWPQYSFCTLHMTHLWSVIRRQNPCQQGFGETDLASSC